MGYLTVPLNSAPGSFKYIGVSLMERKNTAFVVEIMTDIDCEPREIETTFSGVDGIKLSFTRNCSKQNAYLEKKVTLAFVIFSGNHKKMFVV